MNWRELITDPPFDWKYIPLDGRKRPIDPERPPTQLHLQCSALKPKRFKGLNAPKGTAWRTWGSLRHVRWRPSPAARSAL